MNVEELLIVMEEMLEEGAGVPFSGGKRMVDVDRVRDLIDEVRQNLPTELRQAKAIVNDRADIIADARREAEALVRKAEDRARVLVSEQEILKAAQQRATEIMNAAQSKSRETRLSVTDYCENMLRVTEEQMVRSAAELKNLRANLRQTAKSAMEGQQSK